MENYLENAFSSFDKKDEHLKKMMSFLESEGMANHSNINAVRAENEVAWETGSFSDPDDKQDRDEISYGLLVRARRDSLTTSLNSAATLDIIERLELKVSRLNETATAIKHLSYVAVAILAAIALKLWG